MRSLRAWLLVACTAGTLVACAQILGIEDVPVPAGGDSGLPGFDAAGCDACAAIIPSGWTPVLTSTTQTSCPAGYTDLTLAKTSPSFEAGACTCSAGNLVAPSCVVGTLGLELGCMNNPISLTMDGGCATFTGTTQATDSVTPLVPSGGSCTPVASADQSKLSTTTIALCAATACPTDLCAGQAPQGFSACIAQGGDVTCPSGFPKKQIAADTFQVDCSQACTTCAASATCSGGTLTLWASCGDQFPVTAIVADGTCKSGQPAGASVGGATYAANAQGASYDASGPLTALPSPVNARTVCCK